MNSLREVEEVTAELSFKKKMPLNVIGIIGVLSNMKYINKN